MASEASPAGVAVVVGGSGGLGRACVGALARVGADVALTYRKRRAAAEEAAEDARALGRHAEVAQLSLEDPDRVATWFDALAETHERVHSVVFAAGSDIAQPFVSQVTPDQWRQAVHAELDGFFHVVRAALPYLRAAGDGALVALTSAGLRRMPPRDVLSVAPKAGIEALVRSVAREEGRYGVRANCVAVGVVEAGMFLRLREAGELDDAWVEAATRSTPLGRFGQAAEVGEAAAWLVSRGASYVTGQTLVVDGGWTV